MKTKIQQGDYYPCKNENCGKSCIYNDETKQNYPYCFRCRKMKRTPTQSFFDEVLFMIKLGVIYGFFIGLVLGVAFALIIGEVILFLKIILFFTVAGCFVSLFLSLLFSLIRGEKLI